MFTHKTINQRLSQARMQAGLSISQVSRLLGEPVGDWLRDAEIDSSIVVSDEAIEKLSRLYRVDPHWVRTGETSLDVTELEKQIKMASPEDRQSLIDLLSSLEREE